MGNLNREQAGASGPEKGVHLVIAGAGTGKTVTLVEKYRSLVTDGGMRPENILILTFSRKAAGELKSRLLKGRGRDGDKAPQVGTFHSFALGILRRYSQDFKAHSRFSSFPEIISEERREGIVSELVARRRHEFLGLPDVTVERSLARERWSRADLKKLAATGLDRAFSELKESYREYKLLHNLMDYDDIIYFCNGLLEARRDILDEVRRGAGYVLVDEYQDTSDDNFRLLELLLRDGSGNLFAVGDDWQAIYGFRNARVEYILSMKKYFPEVKVHRLVRNYRSRAEIVSLSNRFIRRNRKRSAKRLVSERGRGGAVRHYAVASLREETALLWEIIGKHEGEVAVLFRNNWQGDLLLAGAPGPVRENVHFMTMHASKGLEFETVIISGVSDSIIPDRSSDLEEERRLFYVALSRARERLYIISCYNDELVHARFARELAVAPRRKRP